MGLNLDRLRKRAAKRREEKRLKQFEAMSDEEKEAYVSTLSGPVRAERRAAVRHLKHKEAATGSSDGMRVRRTRRRRAKNKVAKQSRKVNR